MNRHIKDDLKGTFTSSIGWLFADMLLVLTILFLASSVFVEARPLRNRAPTPIPTFMASPTPLPRLELTYHRFTINVDPTGLLSGNTNALNSVVQQVKAQHFLKSRRVGLLIVYGGAPTDAQINTAQQIANRVYSILLNLGKHDATFADASRYDPLYLLGGRANQVSIDIFLFAQ